MEILKITIGPYATHCYLVKEGAFCAAIDAEINDGELQRALDAQGWKLTDILVTHAHFDHVRGINALPVDAVLHIHEEDAPYLAGKNEALGSPFLKEEAIERPYATFRDGDTIGPFTAMHVPGHSPGCALFIAPGHVFCGDSMFVNGIPMLNFPLSDGEAYLRSIARMRKLDPDARLHSGHGSEGVLREGIPAWS